MRITIPIALTALRYPGQGMIQTQRLGGGLGGRNEPAESSVQTRDERDPDKRTLNGIFSVLPGFLPLPVVDLLLRRLGVVRAAGVVDSEIGEHRGAEADALEVGDIRGILEPEDLLLALTKAADTFVQLSGGDRAAPPVGPRKSRTPFSSVGVYSCGRM